MELRDRYYRHLFEKHLAAYRQMLFVSGARQVGKTTTCRQLGLIYLDWDNESHRETILKGPQAVAEFAGLDVVSAGGLPIIVFGVNDLPNEIQKLKSKGVRFRDDLAKPEWGMGNIFEDTCGNFIMLEGIPDD